MIISIAHTKGGVGKSTIATNLAVCFSKDSEVLLVDTDKQASSMLWKYKRTQIIKEEEDKIRTIQLLFPTLHKDLKEFSFQNIIIDTGGKDNSVLRSSILASDMVIIPILPSQIDLWANEDIINILNNAKSYKKFSIFYLLNQVVKSSNIGQETLFLLNQEQNIKLLKSQLTSRIAYKIAYSQGLGVIEYNKKDVKEEMSNLYKEIKSWI